MGYSPADIFQTRRIICVGFSTIAHTYLTELGIEHLALEIPNHSALLAKINNREYYFDPTNNIFEDITDKPRATAGSYTYVSNTKFPNLSYRAGNPEIILQYEVLNGQGSKLQDEALTFYDEIIRLDPDNGSAQYNKGVTLSYLNRYEAAIVCYDEAIRLNPRNGYAWNNKGRTLYRLHRYDEALACYEEAIRIYPKFSYAWSNKGDVLHQLGRDEEAITYSNEAIRLDPKNRYAWNSLKEIYGALGKHEESEKYTIVQRILEDSNTSALP
jgi:tetratricopeptide (TPR) repeat protein